MAITISKCEATSTTIMVFFSGDVSANDPENLGRYQITAPNQGIDSPRALTGGPFVVKYDPFFKVSIITLDKPFKLHFGDPITMEASFLDPGPGAKFTTQVNGIGAEVEAVEDAVAYPLLTEQVSFPGSGGGGGGGWPSATTASLSQAATTALADVLGWKVNPSDAKGFMGALTQSFALTEFEGHTEATWKPRTYAVQTDMSGGITGAQASLYSLAKTALDQSLPLLEGLYPLDPEAEPEDVTALKELARSQMTEIVKELGKVGGPSILRVDTYFEILIGASSLPVPSDADLIGGTLGEIRDTYGLRFGGSQFSNSIDDETDLTNFRIISDYMSSLLQTWLNNKDFFKLGAGSSKQAFLGTQLVLISRQFSVIAETVNEVRFTLNSVFIGPSERQTLLLEFASLAPMFLEDVLAQIETFASGEGPRLIQNGGRLSISNNVSKVVQSLLQIATETRLLANDKTKRVPDGFRTVRVKNALDDLRDQIGVLATLTSGVGRQLPAAEGGLLVFPQSLEFGGNRLTHSVTVINLRTIAITNLAAIAQPPSDFVVTPPGISALAPLQATTIAVRFNRTGTAGGSLRSRLIITADGVEPAIVSLIA